MLTDLARLTRSRLEKNISLGMFWNCKANIFCFMGFLFVVVVFIFLKRDLLILDNRHRDGKVDVNTFASTYEDLTDCYILNT